MECFRVWLRKMFGGHEQSGPGTLLWQASTVPSGPKPFVEENNDFALAMYKLLRQWPGNLFFSPFSIRTALGMTQAGAKGETAAQMREALRFSSSGETLHAAFAETIQQLNVARGGEYEMAVANSLWGQDGRPLQRGFLDLIARHYGGGMHLVDFRRCAEAAHVAINQWVADKTRQKVGDLIPSGGLNADTRLVLVNAVYFKGMWTMQFQLAATRHERFYLGNGEKVQVPLMHQHGEILYQQGAGYHAVDLVYRGGELSLLVQKDGLEDLEKELSVRMLRDCALQMAPREVKLFLPRFKINSETLDIRNHLTTLGMQLAFIRTRANFSRINGSEPPDEDSLFLSAVFNKAVVEVNEEGTEAAAATAALMAPTAARWSAMAPPVRTFRADHPFLFAIRVRKSGAILFLGRMADPTREG